MKLDDLRPAPGARSRRKKIGRGPGSGHGKTSGRGHKGDKARGSSKVGFEGGQTPLHRRLPKQRGVGTGLSSRGFNSGRWKTHYSYINLSDIERFENGTVVTPELLVENKILKDLKLGVKVLADGEFTKKLTVYASKFSGSARARIEALGGTAVLIGGDPNDEDDTDDADAEAESGDATAMDGEASEE